MPMMDTIIKYDKIRQQLIESRMLEAIAECSQWSTTLSTKLEMLYTDLERRLAQVVSEGGKDFSFVLNVSLPIPPFDQIAMVRQLNEFLDRLENEGLTIVDRENLNIVLAQGMESPRNSKCFCYSYYESITVTWETP